MEGYILGRRWVGGGLYSEETGRWRVIVRRRAGGGLYSEETGRWRVI